MKTIKQIKVSGKHWEDILKLSCFRELSHYENWSLLVSVDYLNGEELSYEDSFYGIIVNVGDTLVEYDNGKWGVLRQQRI